MHEVPVDLTLRGTLGPSPRRRPGSARRTTTIDVTWPDGGDGDAHMEATGRDAVTRADGVLEVRDTARAVVRLERTGGITAASCEPHRDGIGALVGVRRGGGWRRAVQEAVPDDFASGSVLHQLLDDLAGTSLVSYYAHLRHMAPEQLATFGHDRDISMVGTCTGFRPGASIMDSEGRTKWEQDVRDAVPPLRDDDPDAWHGWPDLPPLSMRRARLVDVWRADDGAVHVASWFQDTVGDPARGRVAVHEYELAATVDADGVLRSIRATPRVLPHAECPDAVLHVHKLVGLPMRDLRRAAPKAIPTLENCTHLNDAARALTDVPRLSSYL